jgi:OOP family OmpA-OmpF porin
LERALLHFAFNRSDLPAQGQEVLRAWAAGLQGKSLALEVSGHADGSGSRARNRYLSRARARAVAEALRALGLTVVQVEGVGSTHPIASDRTRAGRAQNRRVEIRPANDPAPGVVESEPVPEIPRSTRK